MLETPLFTITITAASTALFVIILTLYLSIKKLGSNLNRSIDKQLNENLAVITDKLHQNQLNASESINKSLLSQMTDIRRQIAHSFKLHTESLSSQTNTIHQEIKQNLSLLAEQVHKQLDAGFDKTNTTFNHIIKRLTIIDEAQKRITELSNQVVSLNDILNDKKSRGAFGEVQLNALIKNTLPPQHFAFQHTLSNRKRADCILFLPQPSGNIVIDSKFPLESYQRLHQDSLDPHQQKTIRQQFKIDIQKHINDIAEKYIIAGETTDSAMLFIPAEAVFAEIHANYPKLIQLSHQKKVWLVSPSTLMAVLTTARAVLKDDATRKQIHIIQQHLQALAKDFERFEKRMDNLNRHIDMAQKDACEVNTSAKKITQRFTKIEAVELSEPELIE